MSNLARRIARAALDRTGWRPPVPFVTPQLRGPDGRLAAALEAMADEPRMVLFAPPGSGKSTLLRAFAHASATALVDGERGSKAPLLIRGTDFEAEQDIEALVRGLGIEATAIEFAELLASGELVLLVDGIDEMEDASQGASNLASLLRRHPALRAVLATRPAAFGAELADLASYSLAPFSRNQIEAVVQGMALGDADAAARFQRYLEQSGVADIIQTPLLVHLLFEASDGGSAPSMSSADLFSDLLDEGLRLASATGAATAEQLLTIMGEMAVRLHVEHRVVGSVAELQIDWDTERGIADPARIPELLVATRLVRVDDGEIMFLHRSIQEFMVARRLYQDPRRLLEALDLGGFATTEILRFAASLSDEVAPLVETLMFRGRVLDAATCVRFARVENEALAAYVAVALGGQIGERFIRRLVQQIPPELDHPDDIEGEPKSHHEGLLDLFDAACDLTLPNHARGAKLEGFTEALFDGPFEPVHRNFRTQHGELDLVMEVRGGTPYWLHWGPDVLVECKNLAAKAEAHHFHTFAHKVGLARAKLGFLVSMNGFTPDAFDGIASQRRGPADPLIVPISGQQIRQLLQRRGPIEAFLKDRMREVLYESKFPES